MLVSPRVRRLFEVELRNVWNIDELDDPTLDSVIDTVQQAPEDVLEEWCKDHVDGLEDEIRALAKRYGGQTYLWDYEAALPAFREITPLERLAGEAE